MRQPTSSPARSIIANGPIGKPNADDRGVDLLRQRAFEQQPLGLDRAARQHPVADKAVADADGDRHLAEPAASATAVASASGAVAAPRTISSSRMTLAGLKKCMPTTSCGRAVAAAISSTSRVEVLVASIAPGFADPVEIGEDPLLEVHLLEHRLDHDIRRGRPRRAR